MSSKPSIPKGTRDFTPAEVAKRDYIFNTIRTVFNRYGYAPIETPAYELLETLTGKYGEEGDKLMFKILPRGEKLTNFLQNSTHKPALSGIVEEALRYDLTVPFARFVVQHQNELTFPFKRYQIQPVWRADKPQKGRYREFYQCDVDVIGSKSLLNEVELIQIITNVFEKLGLKDVVIKLNNRKLLSAIAQYVNAPDKLMDITIAFDKIDKIGLDKVKEELKNKGLSSESIDKLKVFLELKGNNEEKLKVLTSCFQNIEDGQKGLSEINEIFRYTQSLNIHNVELDISLARGLNYYTGAIFEVKTPHFPSSICGGGRYDDLTGIFGLKDMSGVGISFGADRIYDVLEQLRLFPQETVSTTDVLFVNFSEEDTLPLLPYVQQLRAQNISVEIYPDADKLKKQFKYADQKKIKWVVMVGSNERQSNVWKIKNMISGEEKNSSFEELISLIKSA